MQRKLTITIDDEVYEGLYRVVGPRKIGGFIEDLVRPHVVLPDLDAAYGAMAADEAREAEALAWSEALVGDGAGDSHDSTAPAVCVGEVWWVDFDPSVGSEVRKQRPSVVVSNDAANRHLNRVQVVPLSSQVERIYPSEAPVTVQGKPGKAMADQLTTVSKLRLIRCGGTLSDAEMDAVDRAIGIQLGMV